MFGCQSESVLSSARPADDSDDIVIPLRHQPNVALLGSLGIGIEQLH